MALGSAIAREARRVGESLSSPNWRVLRKHPHPSLPRTRERGRTSYVFDL
jgi:hypothetical protein